MLKSIGMVRKVDELGRIVLPIELRRTMNIDIKDSMEIYTDGERVVLQKYEPGCVFCDNMDGVLLNYAGKKICSACIQNLREYAKRLA